MPDEKGNPNLNAASRTLGLNPGATPNCAPQYTALFGLSMVRIVPAPISKAGRSFARI